MELIDRDVLFNSFNDCSCECGVCQYSLDGLPCGLIENAPTVEAIPKADYENRLKADLKAILVELQLEIEELDVSDVVPEYQDGAEETKEYIANMIEEKINSLKENNDV